MNTYPNDPTIGTTTPQVTPVHDNRLLPAVTDAPVGPHTSGVPAGWWQASDGNWYPPESHPSAPGAQQAARPGSAEITIAVVANIGGAFPLAGFFIPLVLFMILKKNQSFARQHVVGALNLQGTLALSTVVAGLLSAFVIPVLIWFAYLVTVFIVSVIGAVTARQGEPYRYPFAIRFIRSTSRHA